MASSCRQLCRELWLFTDIFVILSVPILCLPLIIIIPTAESYCGYVLIVMAIYWVFECIPIAVTSLIPLAIFPVFGIMDASHTARMYFKDICALIFGGIAMAIAIEEWNLHRRIALTVLMIVGTKPRWLLLGFMLVTWFLSIWITNPAATSMMLPIAHAVLVRLSEITNERKDQSNDSHHIGITENDTTEHVVQYAVTDDTVDGKNEIPDLSRTCEVQSEEQIKIETIQVEDGQLKVSDEYRLLAKALLLSICYSASIGGTASLIGTTPQLVLLGLLDERFGNSHPINFLSWMVFSFPASLIFLFITWIWILFVYLDLNPWRKNGLSSCSCSCEKTEEEVIIRGIIKKEFQSLGVWTWAETSVLILFTTLCLLWISRDVGGYGWGFLFPEDYVSDATPAIFMTIVLFCFPSEFPTFFGCRTREDISPTTSKRSLLNWQAIHKKMPWSLFLLLGGGFALAEGMEVSGLSQWIGDQLATLGYLSDALIVLVCTTVICFFTEVTSNTATASIFLPILGAMTEAVCINPLYLLMPCTILCVFAFMLPVGTGSNAMVFATGVVTIKDMALTGLGLNILGIGWLNLWVNSYGNLLFDLEVYPDWARTDNTTCIESTTI